MAGVLRSAQSMFLPLPVVLAPQEDQPLPAPTALQDQAMRSFDLLCQYACSPPKMLRDGPKPTPARRGPEGNLNLPEVQGGYGLGVRALEVERTFGGGSGFRERRVPSQSLIDLGSPFADQSAASLRPIKI